MSLENTFKASNLNKNQAIEVTKKEKKTRSDKLTFEAYLPAAQILLENLKPENFGPGWIFTHNAHVFNRLAVLLPKNENGRANWQYFVDKLPKEWQEKWEMNEHLSFNDCVSKTIITLKKLNPNKFGQKFIIENNRPVYTKLIKILPRNIKNREPDWQYFVDQLPKEWKEKWITQDNTGDEHLLEIISQAKSVLDAINPKPEKIGPVWFFKNKAKIYHRLVSSLPKTKTGATDWNFFVEKLSEDWQKKWEQRGNYGRYGEIEEYSKNEELEQALAGSEDKLYMIPYYSNLEKEEEKETANSIVEIIIRIAQKGNRDARELLEKDLLMVFEDWIEKYPELKPWENASEELKNKTKNMIYNYQGRDKKKFFGYAFKTLKMEARKFPKITKFEDSWIKPKK